MGELNAWLRGELRERRLTQTEVAVYAGVGQATISDILNKDHVPKVETLFRLADYFNVSRERVLRLAGHLPADAATESSAEYGPESDPLVRELLAEFRRVPDEWKPVAVAQVAHFRRLAEIRPVRYVGDSAEEGEGEGDDQAPDAGTDAVQTA
ncbi:MAG: helix-turn-helix transcriptional regulator [Anaerolineae bacterium]|jgi:transcriptional regulator with XRE-family HTH domain